MHDVPLAAASMPTAVLADVCAGYGRRRVLEGISLVLRPGEITALLGPNGSGKTSLIKILTGKLMPERGTLRLNGPARDAVALVPQDLALYPWLTAAENCRAFARLGGGSPSTAADRSVQALAAVGCGDVADTRVGRLSGGYKRRINVAAALVRQPRLLILDEAMVGIDRDARQAIADALAALRAQGTSVLLVTHDLEEAGALADRVAFLSAGTLVAQGEPRALVSDLHGTAKEVQIDLPAAPDETGRARLQARGALPTGHPKTWLIYRALEHWDIRLLVAELEADGFEVREVRLRDPGLATLYAHYCGSAPDA